MADETSIETRPDEGVARGLARARAARISDLRYYLHLELEPGALRELHWHPTADEWQYVLEGSMSMTMFGSHGRFRTETLDQGDVGFIPQGYGHSIENTGKKKCRILIGFNAGVYEDIDLTEWMAGNPMDVLVTNFSQPASVFEKFPKKDVFITEPGSR